ncbi:MAG: CDP-archaeol synthase [Alphaproteobacteria bacterium]|nr:CDP-archaeol synthase [Alphaproteobacteria bacterium]
MPSSQLVPLLFLLLLANGAPLMVRTVLGRRCSYPIDGDRQFLDGRPVFGPAKTLRGVACALLATTAGSLLIGLGWWIGLLVGGLAMVGDLFSSFVKRRLAKSPSSPAVGIDQIPESLLPLLACMRPLSLTIADVAIGVAVFFAGELVLSRVLYAFDLRERPY